MATLDDLFGGREGNFEKRPRPPKWDNVGDFHDIVVTKEPYKEQQKEVGGSWEPLFLEKQPNDRWKRKTQSDLIEGRQSFPLDQIIVEGKLIATGEDTILYFDNQNKREALEAAMAETPLSVGYAIRMTRTENVGKQFGWKIQIAAPKGE